MPEEIKLAFEKFYQSLVAMLPNLLTAVVFFTLFFLIGIVFQKVFQRMISKRWGTTIGLGFLSRMVKWFFILTGGVIALHMMGFGGLANSVVAGAGISALIVGFAFKDIAENFLSGFLLAVSRPFKIGDIIEVDGYKGTVKELDLRTIHLRNVEGKDFFIPNSNIVKNTVINYTRDGLLRLSFMVGFDTPTNIDKAREVILGYLSDQPEVLKKPAPGVITRELGEFTVDVQVLFWIDILKNKEYPASYLGETIRGRIIREVKDLLLEHHFNMPSQVIEHKMYDQGNPLRISGEFRE